MLPARYRMTRSAEFATTVKAGVRAAQPDLVVHARQIAENGGPRIGFVVSKAVGNAVQRHRVARQLRHAARCILTDLEGGDRVVIRALPTIRNASSADLEGQLRAGLRRVRTVTDRGR